jgi:hypothetical protein
MIASLLSSHKATSIIKMDACVCGRVAYYDPVNEELSNYRFADLTECPYEDCLDANKQRNQRYVVNEYGKSVPRNVFYYFPVAVWLQDLFKRPDLVPYLDNSLPPTEFDDGHIRRSSGFRAKVINNPNINADRRHQAVTGSCDGVPLFKDKNAMSAWPFVLKSALLPEGLANEICFAHMAALVPSTFLSDHDQKPITIVR